MNSSGWTQMRASSAAPLLPAAVGWELEQLEGRLGQYADPRARNQLAELGEAAAVRALRTIGESRKPVRTLSGFIRCLAEQELMERNARGIPPAESAVCSSGPSRAEDSVVGPDDDVQMEDEIPNGEMTFDLSNHARIEAVTPAHLMPYGLQSHESPLRAVACMARNPVGMEVESPPGWISSGLQNAVPVEVDSHVPEMAPLMRNNGGMEAGCMNQLSFRMQDQVPPLQADSPIWPLAHEVPDHAMMQVGSPGRCMLSGLQRQVRIESPGRHTILTPTRIASTPSPVRDITKRVQEMGGPSGTVGVETSPMVQCMAPVKPPVTAKASTVSPQMLALGELEFVRIFLIYVYLAGKKIESLKADYIKSLNSLPMDIFESEIWNEFGHKFVAASDRRKNLDWDPSKTRVYHCNIEKRDDSIVTIYKGPYIENIRTHLQKVVGDDNVLVVKFSDIPGLSNADDNFGTYCTFYRQVAEDGIILGLRRYRFFIYKDVGKEKRKEVKMKERNKTSSVRCFFVRTESGWHRDVPYILSNKTIDEARKLFMHIHTAPTMAKYLSRFALILSKTITLDVDLSKVNVITIKDEPCKDENGKPVFKNGEALIHTDGTGLISEDLAKKCPTSVSKGNFLRTHDLQDTVDSKKNQFVIAEHPLLMQIRMFHNGLAVKGTLLVDKRLPPMTIHIRPSMIKVNPDPNLLCGQSINSLELVATSNRPNRAFTSRFLITLLHHGKVPADYFMELLGKALEDVDKSHQKTRDSLQVAFNHADMDDSMSARMILSGIQPEDDAYLQYQLALMSRGERERIKQGRIPIDECYNLMGTTDPTGTLKPSEVCVILDKGQISGEVLVYKHPGLHFGDIHVLTARYSKEIEDVVGNSKYAIFFPISGPRSLADEMANSDFDGDMYWVSRNPQLLKHFEQSEPWTWKQRNSAKKAEQKKPQDFDGSQLETLLFHEYLRTRFTPSPVLGTAADCWLVYMDRLLTHEVQENGTEWESIKTKMLDLVDIYYLALDAPKTGDKINFPKELRVKIYPHFMEKDGFPSYHSTSVLGKIYDEAKARQSETVPSIKISPMACFTEEVVTEERNLWTHHYREYLRESSPLCKVDCEQEKNMRFRDLYRKYKQMLYDAAELEESAKNRFEVFKEACAIYQIVYECALRGNNVGKCGFAWKVAGHALCQFYVIKRGGDTVLCSLPVIRDAIKERWAL